MEKTSRKPVNRQATFDVDHANITNLNLIHPVIEEHQHNGTSEQHNDEYSQHFATDSHTFKPSVSNNVSRHVNNDFKDLSVTQTVSLGPTSKDLNETKYKRHENTHTVSLIGKNNFENQIPITNTSVKITDVSGSSTNVIDTIPKVNVFQHSLSTSIGQSNSLTVTNTAENNTKSRQQISKSIWSKQLNNANNVLATQPSNTNNEVKHSVAIASNTPMENAESDVPINLLKSSSDQKSMKVSVLKGINLQRNVSPVKEDNTSSKDTLLSAYEEVKTNIIDQINLSNQLKVTANIKKDTEGHKSKATIETTSEERQFEGIKVSSKKSNDIQLGDKHQERKLNIDKTRSLPSNNAPVETKFHVTERIAETSLENNIKEKIQIEKVKHVFQEGKTSPLKPSEPFVTANNTNSNILDDLNDSTIEKYRPVSSDQQNASISSQTDEKYKTNHSKVENISELTGLTSLGKQRKPTYVTSLSLTKPDSMSTLTTDCYLQSGQLSPSNQTTQLIHIEQRPLSEMQMMDGRRESYEQIFFERNTLLKAEIAYKERIKQLEDEANDFLKVIEELTNGNTVLRKKVDTLKNEINGKADESFIERVFHLENENKELEYRVKQFEKIIQSTNVPNDDANEIRQLKEQIVNLETENHKRNDENIKLKQAIEHRNEQLENSIKSLTIGMQPVEFGNSTKESENTELYRQLNELRLKNADLQKNVNALEYENETLSESLTQKKNELGEILNVMRNENRFDDEIKDLKNNILQLKKDKHGLETSQLMEKRVLNGQLEEMKSALDIKSHNHDELKIKFDELESENQKLKLEYNPLINQTESQRKEIKQLQEENGRLYKELNEKIKMQSKPLNETESANNDLKEAKLQLEQINNDLQSIITDKEGQICKLIKQLDTIREDREAERKLAKEEKERLTAETEKVDIFEKNIEMMKTEIKHLTENVEQNKLNEKTLSLQLEDKQYQVTNLEQQVFEMNMKLDNYSKRMSELDRVNREIEREKRDWEVKKDKFDDIEASNKRLLEENKRLRSQLEVNSYLTYYKPPQQQSPAEQNQPVIKAWISDKVPMQNSNQIAIYVQRERHSDNRKGTKTNQQHSLQKKHLEFSKSSHLKSSAEQKSLKRDGDKSQNNTHRSLEDLRKSSKSPKSDHSLPELQKEARLTVGFLGLGGYREIHKDRIKAAPKRLF